MHIAFGVTEATLNFKQNGAGAVSILLRHDLIAGHNGSLSLGTNLKAGSEDALGISFPVILALIAAISAAGAQPDFSALSNGGNSNSGNGYSINTFCDFPLLLQYNRGLGTNNEAQNGFGWFIGGGATYTITGVSLTNTGHGTSENFFGWTGNIGIRFHRKWDLGFLATLPMPKSVGPIKHPLLLGLTLACNPRDL